MKVYTDSFLNAVANYLRKTDELDIAEVYTFEERTQYTGGCDTCGYDETVVDISYKDFDGRIREYTFSGNFAQLVRGLTEC
ncbi:hypothetical protein [Nocardia vulneris]|uniref:Uncharacterized protein n=1 Tax=Nocardia vulneris TaxID=1141657 RepID=A0ABR4Z4J6_9NOCA|nr:hypothetical protein [Nocardia vulneris]KIA60240.1 hypothetical protein FG87_38100 [Nocardia vulneris]